MRLGVEANDGKGINGIICNDGEDVGGMIICYKRNFAMKLEDCLSREGVVGVIFFVGLC